ncbi:MAG: carbohydrate ABC transporter permease [Nakamurella sp.]
MTPVAASRSRPVRAVGAVRRAERRAGLALAAPFGVFFVLMFLLPLGYALDVSMFQNRLVGGEAFVGFRNYLRAFSDPLFWNGVGKVLIFGALQTPLIIVLAVLSAFAGLCSISPELYEATALDRAGRIKIACYTKLPALVPTIILTLVFAIIGTFQYFTEPQIFASLAPSAIPPSFTPNLYAYNLAFTNQQYSYSAAISFALGFVVCSPRPPLLRTTLGPGIGHDDLESGHPPPASGCPTHDDAAECPCPDGGAADLLLPSVGLARHIGHQD